MKLSEAFPEDRRDKADIELKVRMININHGHSGDIAGKCRPLYEYSWFIDKIREYNTDGDMEKAADMALEDMPEDFGIKKYLVDNREDVRMSLLTEYDEQKLMDFFKEEGREEGLEKGREEGREESAEKMLNDNVPIAQISKWTGLTIEKITAIAKRVGIASL